MKTEWMAPKIKMCGIKRPEDIKLVNEYKPDYIGFIFAGFSPRFVSFETAKYLKFLLSPDISAVGVFVNEDRDKIIRAAGEGIIDMIQLHGSESYDDIKYIRRKTGKPVIKAIRINDIEPEERAEKIDTCPADYVLIDSGMGSGRTFDWSLLEGIDREYFLAGGLSPENVSEAIKRLHPYALDVSSGIEKDGVKDGELMKEFMDEVRG